MWKWNVDIVVFILTFVEHSCICKFSRIYFIEFKKEKKCTEITLLARILAISFINFVFIFGYLALYNEGNHYWGNSGCVHSIQSYIYKNNT
jgi:hypothetical protein